MISFYGAFCYFPPITTTLHREARDFTAAWWYRLHAVLKVTEHKYSARDRLSHLSKIGTGGIRSASSNEFTPWVVTKVGIYLEYYIMSPSSASHVH